MDLTLNISKKNYETESFLDYPVDPFLVVGNIGECGDGQLAELIRGADNASHVIEPRIRVLEN